MLPKVISLHNFSVHSTILKGISLFAPEHANINFIVPCCMPLWKTNTAAVTDDKHACSLQIVEHNREATLVKDRAAERVMMMCP